MEFKAHSSTVRTGYAPTPADKTGQHGTHSCTKPHSHGYTACVHVSMVASGHTCGWLVGWLLHSCPLSACWVRTQQAGLSLVWLEAGSGKLVPPQCAYWARMWTGVGSHKGADLHPLCPRPLRAYRVRMGLGGLRGANILVCCVRTGMHMLLLLE